MRLARLWALDTAWLSVRVILVDDALCLLIQVTCLLHYCLHFKIKVAFGINIVLLEHQTIAVMNWVGLFDEWDIDLALLASQGDSWPIRRSWRVCWLLHLDRWQVNYLACVYWLPILREEVVWPLRCGIFAKASFLDLTCLELFVDWRSVALPQILCRSLVNLGRYASWLHKFNILTVSDPWAHRHELVHLFWDEWNDQLWLFCVQDLFLLVLESLHKRLKLLLLWLV